MAWSKTLASASLKAWLCALVCLLSAGLAPANDWYAAPNGTPAGNGSIGNPWDLDTALGTESCTPPAAIQPGDTLWLLPGTYHASMSGGFQSCLTGTSAAPIIVRNYSGGRATIDGFGTLNTLYVAGAYTWFWGIEFMDHNPVRSSTLPGSNHQPNSLGPGIYGAGIKFINCVVHDTGYGFSGYALATGLEIYGSLAYYIGYTAPDQNHGYGVYAQNTNGTKLIADNFIGDNADEGIQVYGDTGSLIGITLRGNTAYNAWSWPVPNYQANILMGGGTTVYGNSILENMSYFTLSRQSGSINIGQYSASYSIDVEDNIFVGGGNTITVEGVNSPFTFLNNTLVNLPSGFNSTTQEQVVFGQLPGQVIGGYNWDNNSYYGANLFEIGSYNGLALSNGSSVSFTQWQSDGFDTHSTLVPMLPAGKWVYVRPNQYEPKRANITIYNWDAYDSGGNVVLGKSPTVSVDLSSVLALGDNFVIQDLQNFYGPPVVSGIFTGGTVTIPMEGLAKAAPIGFAAPAHTAPAFGTFIVMLSSTAPPPSCPCTIWSNTGPTVADNGPDSPVELGVKFTSSVNGAITGVRFYKSGNNTGTHIGNLWDSQGNNLASATFSNETASGWQQVTFSSAVNITANTVYVASYHTNVGHYSADQNYFATAVSSPPLQFLAGPNNGVYGYGASAFPGNSYNSTNYWVDVVFSTTVVSTSVPNVVGNTQAAASAAITGAGLAVGVVTQQSSSTVSSGDVISENPAAGTSVTLGSAVSFVVSTGQGVNCPCTIWSNSVPPLVVDAGPGPPVELGVKFRSDSDGTITGLRFFKSAANTGTHIGNLWSSTGTLLATATFSNETGSGWQQVNFSPPVAITANTVYVASYHTSVSHFSLDLNSFAISGVDNPPLHALANGASGGDGVYLYGSASAFPTNTYKSANYWVDVVFTQGAAPPPSCPCTIWGSAAVPTVADSGPDSPVELGVKFTSSSNGMITGVRFYKSSANTGMHVGNLWSSTGTLLATATFSSETASGWQQVNFSPMVAVTANTVYIASYHTSVGHFSADQGFFAANGVNNPPLQALANGVNGGDGVYLYGSTSGFPTNTYNSTNYWVDVVLQ